MNVSGTSSTGLPSPNSQLKHSSGTTVIITISNHMSIYQTLININNSNTDKYGRLALMAELKERPTVYIGFLGSMQLKSGEKYSDKFRLTKVLFQFRFSQGLCKSSRCTHHWGTLLLSLLIGESWLVFQLSVGSMKPHVILERATYLLKGTVQRDFHSVF
jgi:hypothetical protein